ncbi:WASH complex subunit 4 [Galendromus occidentalis]|uniref:WASH complex subunit 4 n=1 Tax=Galendromus occidentalis TaxID=34638 RepID=A0AAJ7SDS1_9ACAR|nr:WASH complex subunit 4 [Galendromus occidentalis]
MRFDMDIDDDSEICKDFALRELRRFGQVVRRHCCHLEETIGEGSSRNRPQVNSFVQKPRDGVNPVLLVKTGSPAFDKIILSISSICLEADALIEQSCFVKQIHDYGESNEAPEVQISKFVPSLRRLQAHVSRCADVIQLAVSQVVGLYSFAPQNDASTSQVIFLSLARLFTSLIALEIVIRQQTVLREHLQIYLRLLKSWKYDPKLSEQVKALLKLMTDINSELLEGTILKDCIRRVRISSPKFSDALKETIRAHLAELDSKVNESQAQILLRSEKFVGLCGLFLLHFTVKQQADRPIFRTIVDLSKKIGPVLLKGNAIWDAPSFFTREIPALGSLFPTQNKPSYYLIQMVPRLSLEVTGYENQTALWLLRMDASFGESDDDYNVETLKNKCKLLLQGHNIVRCVNQHLNLVVSLHVSAKKAMSKSTLVFAARMICVLNALKQGLSRYQSRIDEAIAHADQNLHHQLLETVMKIKQKMSNEKKTDKKKLDANAAVKLAEASLKGPFTKLKEICVNVAKEYIAQIKIIRPDEAETFNSNLKRLSVIANYGNVFRKSLEMWGLSSHHVVLLEVFLSQMYKNNSSVTSGSAPPMIETITSICSSIQRETPSIDSVFQILHESLVDPLCKDIENDLRIQMHTHLVADSRNPFAQNKAQIQTQLKRICQTEYILPTEKISMKRGVERYLERIFYNLTTVALHDWGTYDEMRVIAELKYDAKTVESHLPAETLDQGLDVLNVMRNIEGFSSKFVYNMNNQTFVERVSANKHLNTVNISHIANSIRTHGPGITDTTVNVVYRFLRKQFEILSQLLFNEHIKSRLMRDIAYFRENKESLQQKYPFTRAEKICKSVRNLGMTPEGFTYLDKFRQLMTSVGNAMGYVRMMRTGALEYCAQGNALLPDISDDSYESFVETLKDTPFQDHTEVSDAAKHLDSVIKCLLKQQSGVEGSDYYRHLIEAFEGPFCDERNAYLQNFYILVPSLTLNFVEHIVQSRERLSRKQKNDAIFSDDGFAIGVAFALRLTKQFTNFDSLHWFNSVDEKYIEELKTSQEASRSSFSDEKLSQTISLTAKRIEAYRKEFTLLNHAFTSARIFFKTS